MNCLKSDLFRQELPVSLKLILKLFDKTAREAYAMLNYIHGHECLLRAKILEAFKCSKNDEIRSKRCTRK